MFLHLPLQEISQKHDLNDLATLACGDHKDQFGLAIMHSNVAKTLENKQLLEYWKYTDANGIQRPMNIASANGYTVIVDDGVPCTTVGGAGDNKALKKYTTYLFGRWRDPYRKRPLWMFRWKSNRDAKKNGGQDELITRMRETIHPNGFSFAVPKSGWTESPTDAAAVCDCELGH